MRAPGDQGQRLHLGTLVRQFAALADADGYLLAELPDDVTAANTLIKAASSGAFASLSTTKLLTVEEALDAFSRGGGVQYRAPGAPGS